MIDRLAAILVIVSVLWFVTLTAGCTRTIYVDKPVESRVEVARPCIEADDIPRPPRYAMSRLEPGVSDGKIILSMREEIAERTDFQRILTGILQGCTKL